MVQHCHAYKQKHAVAGLEVLAGTLARGGQITPSPLVVSVAQQLVRLAVLSMAPVDNEREREGKGERRDVRLVTGCLKALAAVAAAAPPSAAEGLAAAALPLVLELRKPRFFFSLHLQPPALLVELLQSLATLQLRWRSSPSSAAASASEASAAPHAAADADDSQQAARDVLFKLLQALWSEAKGLTMEEAAQSASALAKTDVQHARLMAALTKRATEAAGGQEVTAQDVGRVLYAAAHFYGHRGEPGTHHPSVHPGAAEREGSPGRGARLGEGRDAASEGAAQAAQASAAPSSSRKALFSGGGDADAGGRGGIAPSSTPPTAAAQALLSLKRRRARATLPDKVLSDFCSALAHSATRHVKRMDARTLVSVLVSFGRLQHCHKPLLDRAAAALLPLLPSLDGAALSRVAWACTELGLRGKEQGLIDALADTVLRRWEDGSLGVSAGQRCRLAWALLHLTTPQTRAAGAAAAGLSAHGASVGAQQAVGSSSSSSSGSSSVDVASRLRMLVSSMQVGEVAPAGCTSWELACLHQALLALDDRHGQPTNAALMTWLQQGKRLEV